MKLLGFSIILLLLTFKSVLAQQETYFYKLQAIINADHIGKDLIKKIDSLKQTRRPNDSRVKVMFSRDVDFGYKHTRIQIVFNSNCEYQINMLIKNDTIRFSSLMFANEMEGELPYYAGFNKRHGIAYIDSSKALSYLKLRNQFYNSGKTLKDLKNELDLNEIYALRAGDGYNETWYKLHIDTLVRRKDYSEFETMLKSINCETQTYGVRGLELIKKKHRKLPGNDQQIVDYIIKRNSDLESLAGDVGPIIWKAYK